MFAYSTKRKALIHGLKISWFFLLSCVGNFQLNSENNSAEIALYKIRKRWL